MNTFLFFFLGILTGLAFAAIIIQANRPKAEQYEMHIDMSGEEEPIVMRQSLMYMIAEKLDQMQVDFLSQSQLYNNVPQQVRFVQTPDGKVFWIENNELFWAEVGVDGFDLTNKKLARTQDLTEEELENLLIVLNILQNG